MNVGEKELCPFILGRSVVHGARYDRQERASKARGNYDRADQHHHVYGDKLFAIECKGFAQRAEQRHRHDGHDKEQSHGNNGNGVTRQLRALNHQDRPRTD